MDICNAILQENGFQNITARAADNLGNRLYTQAYKALRTNLKTLINIAGVQLEESRAPTQQNGWVPSAELVEGFRQRGAPVEGDAAFEFDEEDLQGDNWQQQLLDAINGEDED